MIPNEFGIGEEGTRLFRSLRFRYQINNDQLEDFETLLRESIANHNCAISDFRDYPFIDDLGGDRFIGGEQSQQRRLERATLVVNYLCEVSKLFIHCLQGPDEIGRFQLERSDSDQNPHGSIFESVRHLFCNATGVPTTVLLAGEWTSLQLGTYWMHHPISITGDEIKQYRIEVPINY